MHVVCLVVFSDLVVISEHDDKYINIHVRTTYNINTIFFELHITPFCQLYKT